MLLNDLKLPLCDLRLEYLNVNAQRSVVEWEFVAQHQFKSRVKNTPIKVLCRPCHLSAGSKGSIFYSTSPGTLESSAPPLFWSR